jgi:hypothetical protein
MVKTGALGIRVEAAIKDALEKAAADDHRSVSSLIERVLAEWLTERGYLRKAKGKQR